MIRRYQILQQRLLAESHSVQQAATKAQVAFAAGGEFRIDAAALNLHAFYSGVERLFEWIARQIDGSLPQGPAWHQDLLAQMTLNVPGLRPPVIRQTTAAALREYLGFRHIVRNLYAWELDEEKVERLLGLLPAALEALDTDLMQFSQFLAQASLADE